MPARGEIPNKLYFRIGEVSDIVGVKPYVLRYWETEFPDVKPTKSKSGQRLYKRRDVESLLRIRKLLYEEKFTINGARKRLKDWGRGEGHSSDGDGGESHQMELLSEAGGRNKSNIPHDGRKVLLKVRKDLESLLKLIREE
ncbi:MAG: MerR family transcriptional regulator [Deltaproteobacteria bacterium]|nr:MerR family transcriptional regulator [Deltaproteobacteria bacterium]